MCEVSNQGGFTDATSADDVQIRPAVGALDAKPGPLVAEVGFGKHGDMILRFFVWHDCKEYETSVPTGTEARRRATWPEWKGAARLTALEWL